MPLFHSCAGAIPERKFPRSVQQSRYAGSFRPYRRCGPGRQSDQTDESLCGCIRWLRCPSCSDFRPSSSGCLLSLADRTVIEEVGVGVVAVDFEHFRDVAESWSALDLNHDMERVSDVAQKIADGDAGHTVIGTPRFAANQVGVAQLNFGRIFDQKNALVFGDEPAEGVEITSFLDEDTVAAVHHHFADGVIEDEMFDGFQKTDSYTP